MKKGRLVLMLMVSLAMAVGAALLARNWLQERMDARASVTPDTATVVVAALEIPFGQSIDASEVRLVDMPTEVAPKSSFSTIEEVVGQVATQTIYPDEVIVAKRIAKNMGGSALAVVLDKGKRAVTVRVNDVLGVAGFLLPGNRVDVLATKRNGGRNSVSSETILSDIKVLAVDQIASPEKDDPVIVRAVTLEVTPVQAERLVKATQEGQVQLTLRNPLDDEVPLVAKAPEPEPEPEPKAEPQPTKVRYVYRQPSQYSVQVIRGTNVSSEKVKE